MAIEHVKCGLSGMRSALRLPMGKDKYLYFINKLYIDYMMEREYFFIVLDSAGLDLPPWSVVPGVTHPLMVASTYISIFTVFPKSSKAGTSSLNSPWKTVSIPTRLVQGPQQEEV